ncbi:uncharacterized protein LOC107841993 [Capsicum annuum]|uniref:uncharacterized protein LOC107841993 n=1 Tax=Capsicum annuum TaxID=4072 RepID=UPI0007BF0EDB|nr:uncharacterized protein LOC107841993 [Capsicum annuum]
MEGCKEFFGKKSGRFWTSFNSTRYKNGETKEDHSARCCCKYNCTTSTCRINYVDILVALCVPSPREAISTLQANQLIRRTSSSSNNGGAEIEEGSGIDELDLI